MATDTEIQPLLDDLMATPRQLQQCGVPVKISPDAHGKPALAYTRFYNGFTYSREPRHE